MKKLAITMLSVFVFVFAFEWVWHANILSGFYQATKEVWRPEEDANYVVFFIRQIGLAVFLPLLFLRTTSSKGVMEGVRFGLLMGALFAAVDLGSVGYLPIPFTLGLTWALGSVAEMVGIGLISAAVYGLLTDRASKVV